MPLNANLTGAGGNILALDGHHVEQCIEQHIGNLGDAHSIVRQRRVTEEHTSRFNVPAEPGVGVGGATGVPFRQRICDFTFSGAAALAEAADAFARLEVSFHDRETLMAGP